MVALDEIVGGLGGGLGGGVLDRVASGDLGMLGVLVEQDAVVPFAGSRAELAERQIGSRLEGGTPVPIPSGGHPVTFAWTAVVGATGAEVNEAGLRIGPATFQQPLGELKTDKQGSQYVVTTSGKRIHSLRLNGLKYLPEGATDQVPLASEGAVPGGFHLVVEAPNPTGGWMPIHAVPAVARQNMIPASLTGASFANGVLGLPDVVATKLRLTFAKGDRPDSFEAQDFALGTVDGSETVVPSDLEVAGPD